MVNLENSAHTNIQTYMYSTGSIGPEVRQNVTARSISQRRLLPLDSQEAEGRRPKTGEPQRPASSSYRFVSSVDKLRTFMVQSPSKPSVHSHPNHQTHNPSFQGSHLRVHTQEDSMSSDCMATSCSPWFQRPSL